MRAAIVDSSAVSAKRAKKKGDKPQDAPPTDLQIAFSRNVLRERERAGMSQRDLAREANVMQTLIWQVETQAKNVTLKTVSKFAKALGTTGIKILSPSDTE